MKKMCMVFLLLLVLLLSGCKGNPGMTGYVMSRENGRVLVVDTIPQDFSSTDGMDEFYNAIWFADAPDEIKLGDKVKVWFDVVAESYPGQSKATRIEVVNAQKPSGADLSESEVLQKVLTSEKNNITQLTAVSSIEYNINSDQWKVVLKNIWDDRGELLEFQIKDK